MTGIEMEGKGLKLKRKKILFSGHFGCCEMIVSSMISYYLIQVYTIQFFLLAY